MRTLLQFMSEFSTTKDPYTMLNQFQTEIDGVISDLEQEKERSESLRRHNQDLELQLQNRSLAQSSVAQHNLDVQQQVNNHLQKEVAELKQKLAEMTEARDALAASLKEKETQAKVFYKGIPDTDWIPLGTGHVTLEFKSASTIRGSEQPFICDFETIIIDDPQYTSHSVRKLESKTKEELIKLCTRQACELNKLQEKWKTNKDLHMDSLSKVASNLERQLEEAKKAHKTDCENYTRQINILYSGKAWLEAGPDLFTARKELLDAKQEVEKLQRELNVVKSDYKNYKNRTFQAIYNPEAQHLHFQAQVRDLRQSLTREQTGRRQLLSKLITVLAKHVTDPAIIKSDADLVNLFDAVLTDYQRSFKHSQQKAEGLCISLNEQNMKIADLEKKISELQQTMTDCFSTLRKFNNAQPSN